MCDDESLPITFCDCFYIFYLCSTILVSNHLSLERHLIQIFAHIFTLEVMDYSWSESESHSVMPSSLWPHGLYSPWNSPGQNTGMGSCSLLQGIFPTQRLNRGLPHCRWILYQLSHQGNPWIIPDCNLFFDYSWFIHIFHLFYFCSYYDIVICIC